MASSWLRAVDVDDRRSCPDADPDHHLLVLGRVALAVDRMRWHDEELAGSGLVDRRA
jgi:hypothetical protein